MTVPLNVENVIIIIRGGRNEVVSPWITLLLPSPNANSEMFFFSYYRGLNE